MTTNAATQAPTMSMLFIGRSDAAGGTLLRSSTTTNATQVIAATSAIKNRSRMGIRGEREKRTRAVTTTTRARTSASSVTQMIRRLNSTESKVVTAAAATPVAGSVAPGVDFQMSLVGMIHRMQ